LFRSGPVLERGGGICITEYVYLFIFTYRSLFFYFWARRTCVFYIFVLVTLTGVAGLSIFVNCDALVTVLVLLVCFIPFLDLE
jgi:hypothetical protein